MSLDRAHRDAHGFGDLGHSSHLDDAGQYAQLRRRQLVELADGPLRRWQVERRFLHEYGCDGTVVGADLSPRSRGQRQDMSDVMLAVTSDERHRAPAWAYVGTIPRGRVEDLMETFCRICIMGRELVIVGTQQHALR